MQIRHQKQQKGPKLKEAKKNEWQEIEGSQMQNRWFSFS